MELTNKNDVCRPLIPLSKLGWHKEYIRGVQDSPLLKTGPPQAKIINPENEFDTNQKIRLGSIYPPQEILHGDDAKESRFVFFKGTLIDEGGSAKIHPAVDRLTGERGIAKVAHLKTNSNTSESIIKTQLEGEIMAAIDKDTYLSKHILKIWDISTVLVDGQETTILFEEEMDPETQPRLSNARGINSLSIYDRLNLVEQLCTTIDRLHVYKIYHHDLSYNNIFVDINNLQIIIGDFGTSNFAYDVEKYGIEASPAWVSPERIDYSGNTKDPGLVSEVFVLTALSYYLISSRNFPYNEDFWPNERSIFYDKSKNFKTGFDPDARRTLINSAPKTLSETQLNRMSSVFEKGLAIDPRDRYQSGSELYKALQNALYPKNKVISFVRN